MAELATAKAVATEQAVHDEAWQQVANLLCQLTVEMALPGFKAGDVLRLQTHAVINSHWRVGSDVPLRVNGRLIALGEFEVVDNHLALRLTELL